MSAYARARGVYLLNGLFKVSNKGSCLDINTVNVCVYIQEVICPLCNCVDREIARLMEKV